MFLSHFLCLFVLCLGLKSEEEKSISLQFLVDHYARVVNFDEKLDNLITKLEIEKDNFDRLRHETVEYMREFDALLSRAKELFDDGQIGRLNSAGFIKIAGKLQAAKALFVRKFGDLPKIITKRMRELGDEIVKAGEEVDELSATKDLYAKHMTIIQIDVDEGDESTIVGVVDLNGIKSLLKLNQRLEGLKNNNIEENDTEKKVEMVEEIEYLENSLIPKMTLENQQDLRNLITSTVWIQDRCQGKFYSMITLGKKVIDAMNEVTVEQRGFKEILDTHNY